jgi:hypothetical protein
MSNPPQRRRRPQPPHQAPPQGAPERRRKKKGGQRIPSFDVYVAVGLQDILARISAADWQKVITYWMLSREDIVLRGPYKNMEIDIVLRGSDSGMLGVRGPSDESKNIPRFKVIRVSDVRKEMLQQAGL